MSRWGDWSWKNRELTQQRKDYKHSDMYKKIHEALQKEKERTDLE